MSDHDPKEDEELNMDESSADSPQNSDFEPLDFCRKYSTSHEFNPYEDSMCDSWGLNDLYCKDNDQNLEEDEESMIVVDDKHTVLSWAAAELSASPSARLMLAEAEEQGWSVAMEPLGGPDFHLDVPEKLIILNDQDIVTSALTRSSYFKNAVLVSFIRALRDIWQEKRHGAFDATYGPENVLMLERVRAADLDIMAIMVAWELRSEGDASLWRHIIGSEEGDIAMRFSGFLEREPTSQFNGKALAAAFQQWFRSEKRVNACDHETLNYMDGVAQSYYDEAHAFGAEKLTPTGVEILSCLPDRTAYLQGEGRNILRDPLYAGLGDPINQAHFMQIMYDLRVTRIQNVPFRDADLADRIFPNGEFTAEDAGKDTRDGSETLH